ncbi:hypothetical protein AB0M44_12185 [Streptosporangium subroseum]|uniref:hypothetical protein n=1 Tax=Streptosporangium subroseum TaxID=106412 RepID=UPI003441A023
MPSRNTGSVRTASVLRDSPVLAMIFRLVARTTTASAVVPTPDRHGDDKVQVTVEMA